MSGLLRSVGVAGLVMTGLASGALAQPTPQVVNSDLPPQTPDWGISSPIAYNVPGITFNNEGPVQHFGGGDGYIFTLVGAGGYLDQTIYLPSGAVITGVTLFLRDMDPDAGVGFWVYRGTGTSTTGLNWVELFSDYSSGATGFQGGYHALPAPETVRNVDPATGETNIYWLQVLLTPQAYNDALGFAGVTVWYRLQVSPAPVSATFNDVPTGYWAFKHIEALAASGITAGCGGGNYCPESTVTRAEMAVFLAKALGLHWPDAFVLP